MVKNIPIGEIELNKGQVEGLPKNPRFIKDYRFEALKKSIEDAPEMLSLRELIVYPNGGKYVVIGGNQRLRACKELGYKEVPCKVLDEQTPAEKLREYTIKDNNAFGDTDFDILANEWDTDELGDWGVEFPNVEIGEMDDVLEEAEEDDFNEETDEVETITKSGDIWQLGEHRLMCGDSTKRDDVARLMQGEEAHLWLTDPPYNVAIENSQGMKIQNDNMGNTDFRNFLQKAFEAASEVLVDGCPFYVWFATREHMNFEGALKDVGLRVRQELIWNKNSLVLGRSHYQWKHEPCLYGWKGETCRYFIERRDRTTVIEDETEINIDKMKASEMKELLHKIYDSNLPTTVIDCAKPTKDAEHPTMKPVRLFGYQVGNSSKRGDIVLDTFGGSGTTIVCCEQLHRKARLMELDPHYCDVIIARWEKLTGSKAIKISA